jgi:hypothetical protein
VRAALPQARGRFAGLDVGWETDRSLRSNLSYRPDITPWLRLEYSSDGRFGTGRSSSYLEFTRDEAGDTLVELQRRFENERRTNRRLTLRAADLFKAWLGAPDSVPGMGGRVRRLLGGLEPLDLNWTHTLSSVYEREPPFRDCVISWGSAASGLPVRRPRHGRACPGARGLPGRHRDRAHQALSFGVTYRTSSTSSVDARAGLRSRTSAPGQASA